MAVYIVVSGVDVRSNPRSTNFAFCVGGIRQMARHEAYNPLPIQGWACDRLRLQMTLAAFRLAT